MTTPEIAEAVTAANAAFYDAFESGDLDAIERVWSHADDVTCAHPGRTPIRGWTDVRASWKLIVEAGNAPQMILTDIEVSVRETVAWVTVTENMLAGGQTAAAAAINVFEMIDDRWRMVAHHAGPVVR